MRAEILGPGWLALVVTLLVASCRATSDGAPSARTSLPSDSPNQPQSRAPAESTQPEPRDVARARSHQHTDAEAIVALTSHGLSESDVPPCEIRAFKDGCFRVERGFRLEDQVLGSVSSWVIGKLCHDVEVLGVARFAEAYELRDNAGQRLELEVLCGDVRKSIRYTEVTDELRVELALERGESFARELFIVQLLGARLMDLAFSRN